jgi:hypothetical protein
MDGSARYFSKDPNASSTDYTSSDKSGTNIPSQAFTWSKEQCREILFSKKFSENLTEIINLLQPLDADRDWFISYPEILGLINRNNFSGSSKGSNPLLISQMFPEKSLAAVLSDLFLLAHLQYRIASDNCRCMAM